jgi:hypothetical protein
MSIDGGHGIALNSTKTQCFLMKTFQACVILRVFTEEG